MDRGFAPRAFEFRFGRIRRIRRPTFLQAGNQSVLFTAISFEMDEWIPLEDSDVGVERKIFVPDEVRAGIDARAKPVENVVLGWIDAGSDEAGVVP